MSVSAYLGIKIRGRVTVDAEMTSVTHDYDGEISYCANKIERQKWRNSVFSRLQH